MATRSPGSPVLGLPFRRELQAMQRKKQYQQSPIAIVASVATSESMVLAVLVALKPVCKL
ncbi:MAG: hypothetical protein V4722_22375 [Bacteroidota bacterium]